MSNSAERHLHVGSCGDYTCQLCHFVYHQLQQHAMPCQLQLPCVVIALACMQAAKEVAHLRTSHLWSTKGQGSSAASTALPIWQEQALIHLNLCGPNANLEILIGRDPPVDPRLLAALRVLYCNDPTELGGRSLVQLGAWGSFLTPANEVCSSSMFLTAFFPQKGVPHFGTTVLIDEAGSQHTLGFTTEHTHSASAITR